MGRLIISNKGRFVDKIERIGQDTSYVFICIKSYATHPPMLLPILWHYLGIVLFYFILLFYLAFA